MLEAFLRYRVLPGSYMQCPVSLTIITALHHHLNRAHHVIFYRGAQVCKQVLANSETTTDHSPMSLNMPQWDAILHGTSEKVVASLRLRIRPKSNSSCPLCLHLRSPSLGFSCTLMDWMGYGEWFGIFTKHTDPTDKEQDPVFLAPPTMFLVCLFSVTDFSQRISLIR